MKLPVAASIAVVVLTCIASAVGAGGQVVDHGKVVEDPQLDYRKFNKEIAAGDAADRSRQAEAVTSAQQSVVQDEIAFRASLAAVAQSLNAAAPADGTPAEGDTSAVAPAPAEAPHGLSIGVLIAIGALVLAIFVGIGLALSPKRRRKSRRHQPQEESVRLVDFARKSDAEKTDD